MTEKINCMYCDLDCVERTMYCDAEVNGKTYVAMTDCYYCDHCREIIMNGKQMDMFRNLINNQSKVKCYEEARI